MAEVVEGVGSWVVGSHRHSELAGESGHEVSGEDHQSEDVEPIYSSRVQLVYTPPGFERTLHIEGISILCITIQDTDSINLQGHRSTLHRLPSFVTL